MTVDGSLQFSYDYENRNWGMPQTAGAKIQHDVICCLWNFPQVCKGWLGQPSVTMPIAKGGLHGKKRKKYGRTQRCRRAKKRNSSISGQGTVKQKNKRKNTTVKETVIRLMQLRPSTVASRGLVARNNHFWNLPFTMAYLQKKQRDDPDIGPIAE